MIVLFFIVLSSQLIVAEDITKGLYFYAYEVNKESRTSLRIPISEINSLHDGFSMSFEIMIRNEKQNFGYVFRLIAKNGANMDLVISDLRASDGPKLFSLIADRKSIMQFDKKEMPAFQFDTWNKVHISFSSENISITINDVVKTYTDDYTDIPVSDIYFGFNNCPKFYTTETPPMIIKNIRFFNKENEEIRYWSLDKHGTDIVYDKYKKDKAFVLNPKWEIDNHIVWKKQKDLKFAPYPQIAYDNDNGRIFISSGSRMLVYNIQSNRIDTIKDIRGTPYSYHSNHTLYDGNNKNIVSYNLLLTPSDNKLSTFDFDSKEWNNENKSEQKPYFWHHGRLFIPEDSMLITVGGYGFHKYRGIMNKYSFRDEKWEETDISKSISPRYLGAIGYLGDGKILYFGGYGSESGNQEESPRNYYDLYLIDIRNDSIRKLWDMKLPEEGEHYTNSNSMIIDKDNDAFYLLSYSNRLDETNIQARKFKISTPECTLVGDTIPYVFSDNRSYCDLFYCSQSNVMAAITAHTQDEEYSEVSIYTINYRPLNKEDVFQAKQTSSNYWYLVALLALPVLFFWWKKSPRKGKMKSYVSKPVDVSSGTVNYEPVPLDIPSSSITLLGNFNVIDDLGVDVTGNFTPITSQLFLLCLFSSIKNGKGISSHELRNILWFDKDDESARNNRNVNVSKLRVILKNLKKFEIINDNAYWFVSFGKEVFCDYKNVLSLIKNIENGETVSKNELNRLLDLASKGTLLPNLQVEWLDDYKTEYSNLLIEKLFQISERKDVKTDLALVVKITNVILLHDNIDEDAIAKKCNALYYLGKKGKAKQCFEKFTKDYKSILGIEYKYTFDRFRDLYLICSNSG
jgi:DNA-binding SARP family transcriptional activator